MAETLPSGPPDAGLTLQAVDFDPFAPPPQESERRLALTAAQREVFAAVQMGADASAAFNLCNVLRLQGPLDHRLVADAWRQVVQRHAALRSRIALDGSEQIIQAEVPIELPRIDLGLLPEPEALKALAELAADEAAVRLDLHTAPLWRVRLLSWGAQSHALVVNVHHIISDGWSLAVLLSDWAQAVTAGVDGRQPTWPEACAYDDFVRQQLSLKHAAREQADLDYWRTRHTPLADPLALPLDRPRPALKTYACAAETLVLNEDRSRGLRALAARQGCTVFALLLASFQALLSRLSGQADLVVGVPLALQTQLDNAHVVGDGARVVPLRQTLDVDAPLSDLLKATRRQLLDAHEHASLSVGNLVRAMQLPLEPSRTPLVDVIFNLDRSVAIPDFGAAHSVGVDSTKVLSNNELVVDVVDDGRDLRAHLRYLTALWDAATMRRWLRLWHQGLDRWLGDPRLTPVQAFLVGSDERTLWDSFNATSRAFNGPHRLELLVAEQAQRTPQLPAVWSLGRCVGYAELEHRANGIAYALQAQGVVPGDRVGLACGRHAEMVAGVLGILKAGAAYVPLDPALPSARLGFMVADAGVRWVLCDAENAAHVRWPGVDRIDLDNCPPREQAPAWPLQADDPAYVIYTSGTTGRPKGVVVAHRSVCNLIHSLKLQPGMQAGERHALVATLSFDMSVMDLFLPLSVGACVVVIDRDDLADGQELAQRLAESGATSMQAAPSIWRHLLAAGWSGQGRFRAFSGGEALPADLAAQLLASCAELWNFYGPTETSVYSTLARIDDTNRGIRVGLPVANTQIQVLDDQLRPVPFGSVGEICIGGDGLALGYLNQPELTAQRFVPDPERPGQRLYRTGDLGRWRDDGLECLGRRDQQLKLRGWRIEPGEIEACLLAEAGVRQALVQPVQTSTGTMVLCAYVVTDPADADAAVLRQRLRQQLPEVMVPTHWVRLDALPLLPSGKVDRQALPEPMAHSASELLSPASALSHDEQRVAQIWRELLGVGDVRATDNFFDLGGHSLLAARAAHQMSAALGFTVEVPRLVMESLGQVVRPPQQARPRPPAESAGASRLGSWMKRWTGGGSAR